MNLRVHCDALLVATHLGLCWTAAVRGAAAEVGPWRFNISKWTEYSVSLGMNLPGAPAGELRQAMPRWVAGGNRNKSACEGARVELSAHSEYEADGDIVQYYVWCFSSARGQWGLANIGNRKTTKL